MALDLSVDLSSGFFGSALSKFKFFPTRPMNENSIGTTFQIYRDDNVSTLGHHQTTLANHTAATTARQSRPSSDLTSALGPSPSATLYPNRTSDGDADANIVGNGKGIGKVTRPRAPTVNELRPRKKKRVELQTLKPEELGLESEFTVTSKSSVGSVANAMDVESLSKPVVSEMDTENDVDVDMVTQPQAQACINELQPKKGPKIH